MCTLSWIDAHSEQGRVREVFFNRDERLSRGPEQPPFVWAQGAIPFLAPQDRDAGGTWVAVNASGIAIGLLNGYHERRGPAPHEVRSRGLLVRDLASSLMVCEWPEDELDPAPYEPFVLALLSRENAAVYRWDGRELQWESAPRAPLVSSSFEPQNVRPHREQLWRQWSADGPPQDREAALAYHRHAPNGGDAWSPSMRRSDAATRSLCHLTIANDAVSLAYTPGPPHQTSMEPALTLARLAPRRP